MIIVIFYIMAIICYYLEKKVNDFDLQSFLGFLGLMSAIIGVGMSVIALIINIFGYTNIYSNQQIYSSLVYQYENNVFDNDNDLGKKELFNQIQNWNASVSNGQAMQHDFWFGVFWANIYDDFELIELEVQDEQIPK